MLREVASVLTRLDWAGASPPERSDPTSPGLLTSPLLGSLPMPEVSPPRGSGETRPVSRKSTWLKSNTGFMCTSQSTGLNAVSPLNRSASNARSDVRNWDWLSPKKSKLPDLAALSPLGTGSFRSSATTEADAVSLRKTSCPRIGRSPFRVLWR